MLGPWFFTENIEMVGSNRARAAGVRPCLETMTYLHGQIYYSETGPHLVLSSARTKRAIEFMERNLVMAAAADSWTRLSK